MMQNLEHMLEPKSIAIIGSSTDSHKLGFQITNNIIKSGYDGEIYPVNPKGGEILGLRVYRNIGEVSREIDLAIIVIPSQFVLDVTKECVGKVKSLIIISAGFAETNESGQKLQNEIRDICQKSNMAMLGPNCLGLVNTDMKLNATFSSAFPDHGNVSLISQSGAMISALIDWSKSNSLGFSKIFSMGNKALLKESDILEYLYQDNSTEVITVYLEQIIADENLTKTLIENCKKKPTVVLFGGKTSFGAEAALSHTGSIVSSYLAIETYFLQAGVIIASNLNELFNFTELFSKYRKINGNKIAIVTNAGGPSIAACDAIYKSNLALANLSQETQQKLAKVSNPAASVKNPIDILGDADEEDYRNAIEIICSDQNVDGCIVLLTKQSSTDDIKIAEVISEISDSKPIVSAFIGGDNLDEARLLVKKSGKPCCSYPEEAVLSLKALSDFCAQKQELYLPKTSNETFLPEQESKLLSNFDLPFVRYVKSNSFEELKDDASSIGYPVVLKTADPKTIHKSDNGGVILDIKSEAELKIAFEKIGLPVIVGKMLKGKDSLFLGIKKDPNIGTVVAFGTGGIYAEIYKDFSYRVSPISEEMAKKMISETKMGQILNGARGQKKYDIDLLSKIIVKATQFADNYSNIKEADFNPIIANEDGYNIVDARIILDEGKDD